MQQKDIQKLQEKARQLADTEREIFRLMSCAGQNIDRATAGAGMPSLIPVVVPAVLTAGILAAIVILREKGMAVIVLVLALLFMLGKVYSNWQNYCMRRDALEDSNTCVRQSKELEKRQKALLAELHQMCGASESRRFWWDVGLDPASLPRMPGQMLPRDEDWSLGIFNELRLEPLEGGIYLHDFLEEPVYYEAGWVEALRTGRTAELYRNEEAYRSGASVYRCLHLYASHRTPIEEITSHTTVQSVDREQVLRDYRDKVDELERTSNFLLNGEYETNEGLYQAGRVSVSDYVSADTHRRLKEYDVRDRIPDEIRHTQYAKSFQFLWYMEFFSCARIFIAADGPCAGQTALILMPTEPQDSIGFTVRTKSATELGGYLESYIGMEPLEIGATHLRLSLAAFAGTLFGGHLREYLGLCKRDVLAEKPHGLTDEEWVYLIRMDG